MNRHSHDQWADKVLEKYPEGVDLVLDCVGGSYADQHQKVLAADGTWVLYGLMGGLNLGENSKLLASVLRKRITLRGTTLMPRTMDYKAGLATDLLSAAMDKFADKRFRPVIDSQSFAGLEKAQEAHEYMESNNSTGKILLLVEQEKDEEL